MNCQRCGKWAGAHATLSGQPRDHLCMCQPARVPLTEEQRMQLFVELNQPCVQADSPSAMFALIVQAVERAHGIGA